MIPAASGCRVANAATGARVGAMVDDVRSSVGSTADPGSRAVDVGWPGVGSPGAGFADAGSAAESRCSGRVGG